MALGLAQQLPVDEMHNYPREYLLNNLVILFGWRVAEELVLGRIATGAGNGIEKATGLVRRMACEWRMSEKLGPMTFGKKKKRFSWEEILPRRQTIRRARPLRSTLRSGALSKRATI